MAYGLGRVGVWSRWLREGPAEDRREGLAEIEGLGYGTVWLPGMAGGADYFKAVESALQATSTLMVATGILNIWGHDAAEVGHWATRLNDAFPGRFLLGLGVSHSNLMPRQYTRPLDSMASYLDELDRHEGSGWDRRVLAALGPKMVELARTRSLGVHPYNVTTRYTAAVRAALGPGPLVAPEQTVVLEEDRDLALDMARRYYGQYVAFPNYTRNFRRMGYNDGDLGNGGSAKFVTDLVATGGAEAVAARLQAHHVAGADHVCVQVWDPSVRHEQSSDPRPQLRQLANVLHSLE